MADDKDTDEARVPKELADSIVQDEAGHDVRLGDLWRERPIVLAFVRHFG
jgi:hypothetical protein